MTTPRERIQLKLRHPKLNPDILVSLSFSALLAFKAESLLKLGYGNFSFVVKFANEVSLINP